eukprot:CAMPEP_0173327646 /NCGR_PEP_ID=MMETSP1144-20121109/1720_1 /TAXON_ID=483371 /ORGANISM="non described non described, Strain CCMP2298" /LENGTH=682 /DNA_ID=CAMNT_0014272057 /DNA_START=76 /DNA_END=2121 /DNA_ORIENTATION=-
MDAFDFLSDSQNIAHVFQPSGSPSVELSLNQRVKFKVKSIITKYIAVKFFKRQSPNCICLFASICASICLGMFFLLFTYEYKDQISSTFISLDNSAGNCEEVTSPLSGSYLASVYGTWEGTAEGFHYSDAIFDIKFNSLEMTESQFYTLLTDDFSMQPIKDQFSNNNVIDNLIFWMGYRMQYVDGTNVQELHTLGFPSVMLEGRNKDGTAYSANVAECKASTTQFDSFTGVYTLLFNPSNSDCNLDILETDDRNDNGVKFKLNVNSFASALAINQGYFPITYLEAAPNGNTFTYGTSTLRRRLYFDPKYERMEALECVTSDTDEFSWLPYCFVVASSDLFIPILTHFDDACTDACGATTNNAACSDLDVQISLIFASTSTIGSNDDDDGGADGYGGALLAYLPIIAEYNVSRLQKFVGDAYNTLNTDLFDVCADCSVITVSTWGGDAIFSPYGFRIADTHCEDSFPTTTMSVLGTDPPTGLVEEYYECSSSQLSATFNAISVAFGNISIFSYLVIILTLLLFFLVIKFLMDPPLEQSFTDMEEQLAQSELIYALLLANKGDKSIRPNGALMALVEELRELGEDRKAGRDLVAEENEKNRSGKDPPLEQSFTDMEEQLAQSELIYALLLANKGDKSIRPNGALMALVEELRELGEDRKAGRDLVAEENEKNRSGKDPPLEQSF